MPSGISKKEICLLLLAIKKSKLQSSILPQSQTLESHCGNFQNVVNDARLWVGNTEPRPGGHKLEDSQLPEGSTLTQGRLAVDNAVAMNIMCI
jgi:hypothetical protein